MVQGISRIQLNKNFSDDRMKKIGNVSFKGSGVQRGATLKKTLIGLAGGKTKTQAERELVRQGISGSQLKKRQRILKTAFISDKVMANGKKNMSNDSKVLTKDQIIRNLVRNRESGDLEKELSETIYGGGRVQIISTTRKDAGVGINVGGRTKAQMEGVKGTAKDILGGGANTAGFALGNKPLSKQPPAVTPPSRGVKPLGM